MEIIIIVSIIIIHSFIIIYFAVKLGHFLVWRKIRLVKQTSKEKIGSIAV